MKYIEEGRKMKDKIIVKGARVKKKKNIGVRMKRKTPRMCLSGR